MLVTQSCLTLCDPMDYSLPGSSVHGILWARILEWVAILLLGEGVCYDQCVLLAELYKPLPCFILYSKAKFVCYSRYFLTSYFCIPAPCYEKDIFFWVLVLKGLVEKIVGHNYGTVVFSLFSFAGLLDPHRHIRNWLEMQSLKPSRPHRSSSITL